MRANLLAASAIVVASAGGASAQSDQPGAAPPAQPSGQVQATQPQPGQAQPQGASAGQRQVAQRCLDDLGALEARMNEEGFWLTGWRGGATMGPAAPSAAGTPPAGAAAPSPDPGAAMGVGEAGPALPGAGPWGGVGWADAPRHELGALHTAASVLGRRGDEQACQAVLRELAEMYDRYAGELRAAGVEPGRITDWRFRQLAAAKPVAELGPRVRLDDVTGTEVRNRADERLGSVDDVLLDPQGGISHVVVARGGFLGLGQTRVAVPWERLQATPGLNTFVLDVGGEVIAAAPEVDPAALGDPQVYQRWRQETDRFWQQHAG